MIKYQQLKMHPGYTMEDIREKIAQNLHIPPNSINDPEILRERKGRLPFMKKRS